MFLEKAFDLHSSARNRLVYLLQTSLPNFGVWKTAHCKPAYCGFQLADTTTFAEDVRRTFSLPGTEQYKNFLRHHEAKRASVNSDFFSTPAMTDPSWKEAGSRKRHVMTRIACHGSHFLLCQTTGFHEPNPDCTCRLCYRLCRRYHGSECPKISSQPHDTLLM